VEFNTVMVGIRRLLLGSFSSSTHMASILTFAFKDGSGIGLTQKNRANAQPTGIKIAPRMIAVRVTRLIRIPGCMVSELRRFLRRTIRSTMDSLREMST